MFTLLLYMCSWLLEVMEKEKPYTQVTTLSEPGSLLFLWSNGIWAKRSILLHGCLSKNTICWLQRSTLAGTLPLKNITSFIILFPLYVVYTARVTMKTIKKLKCKITEWWMTIRVKMHSTWVGYISCLTKQFSMHHSNHYCRKTIIFYATPYLFWNGIL